AMLQSAQAPGWRAGLLLRLCLVSVCLQVTAFGIPLSQVIANDWTHKQMQEAVKGSRRDCLEVEATVTKFRAQIQKKSPFVGGCVLELGGEFADEPLSPTFLDTVSRSHRRGGVSVDSITDLGDNTSRLLEALQLSHPNELDLRRTLERNKTLSLNPIYRQVPRVVDRCCQHIEAYGLQTVGIFRVGSSKKRVQQLREEFDQGFDVFLDDSYCVHDVAPESQHPRTHFTRLGTKGCLLVYLLPPCNSDTLYQLLQFLNKVAQHAQDSTLVLLGRYLTLISVFASNLATIFGPNLLQREKLLERDPSAHAMEIENSASIILVLQSLIENYEALFMVGKEAFTMKFLNLPLLFAVSCHGSGAVQRPQPAFLVESFVTGLRDLICSLCKRGNGPAIVGNFPGFCTTPVKWASGRI
uniref:Rho GTPase activating protein 36 n=1 Tax=Terrapene triunguis TaxID=2587831 RepID=A0A674IPS6_9SAUR